MKMYSDKIINNILGKGPRMDKVSFNKEYLGYDIKQKQVGQYGSVYIILKDGEELSDVNGGNLYFQTYNQAKYYIEKNLR
jgi:hypothetical protein